MIRNQKGFTLIEMVVVLAVIAVLAAILTPMITGYVTNARIRRAENDCKAIAAAITQFNLDVGEWPIWEVGTSTGPNDAFYDVLLSPGDAPFDSTGTWSADVEDIADQLNDNVVSYPTTGRHRQWKGPYLPDVSEDPWGNKYLVNVASLAPGATEQAIFVLSAGPNEFIETEYAQGIVTPALGGDDIWCRIR